MSVPHPAGRAHPGLAADERLPPLVCLAIIVGVSGMLWAGLIWIVVKLL